MDRVKPFGSGWVTNFSHLVVGLGPGYKLYFFPSKCLLNAVESLHILCTPRNFMTDCVVFAALLTILSVLCVTQLISIGYLRVMWTLLI